MPEKFGWGFHAAKEHSRVAARTTLLDASGMGAGEMYGFETMML